MKKDICPLLIKEVEKVMDDAGKIDVPNAFFASVFTNKAVTVYLTRSISTRE